MSKKIVFKINKEGNAVIDQVEGFGSACVDATKFLERALGQADESSRLLTDEYNEPVKSSDLEHIHH